MQVKSLIQQYNQQLDKIDVELLICKALAVPRSWLLGHDLDLLDSQQINSCEALLARRLKGEPVAHILGEREFWDFTVTVAPSTLIPRPDTEVLVETALELASLLPNEAPVIADLGTGTGAIAIALAKELRGATVLAGEFSAQAATLAWHNIRRICPGQVQLWQGSWADALALQSLDMLVSNPPYIDPKDPHLAQGDVRFEPLSALTAEQNGLADIQDLCRQGMQVIKPGGWLLVEHGYDQEQSVSQLFEAAGYIRIRCLKDYGGNPRVTLGQRPC